MWWRINAGFSRARWFFPQRVRPARRRAQRNSRRAREKSAMNGIMQAQQAKAKSISKIERKEEGEMRSGMNLSGGSEKLPQKQLAGRDVRQEQPKTQITQNSKANSNSKPDRLKPVLLIGRQQAELNCELQAVERAGMGRDVAESRLPDHLRATAVAKHGEYDARRLRSQREVIRDVMLAAADCDTWLTLGELRALTRYGEASISAQLRHLRKMENGGYELAKRHREGAAVAHPAADGRGECVWEYHLARVVDDINVANSV